MLTLSVLFCASLLILPEVSEQAKEKDVNECKVNNGGCSQICVDDVKGFHCACFTGFTLKGDKECEDIDECAIYGMCSQLCTNLKGSFKCSCMEGYAVDPENRRRCKALGSPASLLYADRPNLRSFSLHDSADSVVLGGRSGAVAVDYNFENNTMLWTDVLQRKVFMAPLTKFEPVSDVVSRVSTPDGVAIDWVHGNVYWTDTGDDTVNVAKVTNGVRKTLFQEGVDEPRAIAVDPNEGWMFWTDWGVVPCIERAGMDGTQRSVIISDNLQWPNGLAIDLVSRKIFYADGKLSYLASADFDGSNQRVIARTGIKQPFGIDVFEDWLYWTDWNAKSVFKVNKFTGKEQVALVSGLNNPMGLRVFHKYKQPKGSNHCGPLNGGCSHLCLPSPPPLKGSAKYACACPDDLVLTENALNCISTGPVKAPSKECSTLKQLKRNLKKMDPTVVGLFDSNETELYRNFIDAAITLKGNFSFLHSFEKETREHFGLRNPDIVVVMSEIFTSDYESDKYVFGKKEATSDAISDFVKSHELPLVGQRNLKRQWKYEKYPLVVVYYNVDFSLDLNAQTQLIRKEVVKVAKDYQGRVTFAISDEGEYEDELRQVHLDDSGEDVIVIFHNSSWTKYRMEPAEDFSADTLAAFVKGVLSGRIPKHIKSQPVPMHKSPLVAVVGSTFEQLVLNNPRDVFVVFYDPRSPRHRGFPLFNRLAKVFAANKDVVIAKFDPTANDCPDEFRNQPWRLPYAFFVHANKEHEMSRIIFDTIDEDLILKVTQIINDKLLIRKIDQLKSKTEL